MRLERTPELSSTMQQALRELETMIREHYPEATFEVGPGEDDPEAVHLTATVDVDDPDEVMDLVVERVMAFQVEENLPLHVIPIRTPERVAALQRAHESAAPHRREYLPPPAP